MIPLAVPNLTGNEKKYLNNCIETTFVSSVGEYVTRLEEMAAEATGSAYAVAASAGTTGLHVALTAVGVSYGDLVILPTFTFIASANAIRHCGADPWLMDISDADWCLDPSIVQKNIELECEFRNGKLIHKPTGRRIAALMPVYTLGNIPDMEAFRRIADEYNIPLIADAACAIGASYQGKPFGALADVSVLSFNGNKTVTCGGGGMIIGNDKVLLSHIRHLTTTARVDAEYNFDMVGFNYRMTNIQAAVGCAQMERLEEFIETKRKVRTFYNIALADIAERNDISFFPASCGSSCWFSGIVLPLSFTIEDVRNTVAVLKEKGVESRTFWKPVHLQEPYYSTPHSNMDTSESLWKRIITLPCSTGIMDMELQYIAECIKEILS